MRESNSAKADSISFSSTVQFFTPPSPQSNRARELHHSVRPRRRLFSSGGERHNNQELNHAELDDLLNDPVVIRNLFNEESWAPVEGQFSAESSGSYCSPVEDQVPEESNGSFWAPVEDHVPAESNDSYSLHNQTENRYSSVPSRVPYNLEGIQNNYENGNYDSLEPSVTPYNLEDALQNFLGQSNEEDLIWETGSKDTQFEGLNNGSWSDDDDFDGRFFDTSAWKPHTVSDQQWRVLEAISQGKSVFVTGSAGTGKTYLLEFAKRVLAELYDPLSVFVTASTGIAACALKGRTLHSFAGVGLGDKPAPVLASRISDRENSEALKRWKSARALIIDEISMIDGDLFDKLDYIARDIRRNKRVFGGLQLVVTGDFFQLPPVKPVNPRKEFAFEAKCWNKCFDMQIELKEVFRQADREFVGMLNEIRKGWCSPNTKVRLSYCTGPLSWTHGIAPTRLFPKKFDVRQENDMELIALNKEIIPFTARDTGAKKHLVNNGVAPKELYLCEGAQVVLIWNLDVEIGLVNGARGVVTGFTCSEMRESRDVSPRGLWPVVRFDCLETEQVLRPVAWEVHEGKELVASRRQVPLILAWALSVHKCQGMTLDRVQTDLSNAFECGMVYVALSRVRNLKGLQLTGFDPSKIKAHPKVIKFYETFTEENDDYGNHTDQF